MKRPIIVALATLLTSCFFAPKTEVYYDEDCQIEAKKMVLTAEQLPPLTSGTHCESDCATQLAIMFSITPVSAIVSGSIVVVGNTVYWLQKVGNCRPKSESGTVT